MQQGHHPPREEHGNHCAHADAHEPAPKHEAQGRGQKEAGDIQDILAEAQALSRATGDGRRHAVPRIGDEAGPHGEDDAAARQDDGPQEHGAAPHRGDRLGQKAPEDADEKAGEEAGDELQRLDGLEGPAQKEPLKKDQEAVVEKAHEAERDADQFAQVPGHGEDGGDAQLGLGVHGDAAA